jgi:PhnB protein
MPARKHIEREESMATVVSHIVVREAGKAADWYATALGADVGRRIQVPDGRFMQIELRFGDSQVMIADESPEMGAVSPLTLGGTYGALTIATDDADALWQRALDAGAEVFHPLEDAFWGERHGQIVDPFGHRWASPSTSRTFRTRRCSGAPRSSSARHRARLAGSPLHLSLAVQRLDGARREVREGQVVVVGLRDLDVGHRRHAPEELHARREVPIRQFAALPERDPERRPFLRERHEPVESLHVTEPAEHLLGDDGGPIDGLVRGVDASEADVHEHSSFGGDGLPNCGTSCREGALVAR